MKHRRRTIGRLQILSLICLCLVGYLTSMIHAARAEQVQSRNMVGYRGGRLLYFEGILNISINSNANRIALCHWERSSAQVFALPSGRTVSEEILVTGRVWRVALSTSGNWLAASGSDRNIVLWNESSGVSYVSCANGESSLEFSHDERLLLACGVSGATVLGIGAQSFSDELSGVTGPTVGAFSPDGTRIVTAGSDGTLSLRLAHDRSRYTTGKCDTDVQEVLFAPDGTRFATVGTEGKVQVWNVANLAAASQTYMHEQGVSCIALSPGSTLLATGSADCMIRLWNVGGTSQAPCAIIACNGRPATLAFNPDGTALAAAISGGDAPWVNGSAFQPFIGLWHIGMGVAPRPFTILPCDATSLSFTADGASLVAAGRDGILRLWDCSESLFGMEIIERGTRASEKASLYGVNDVIPPMHIPGPNLPDHGDAFTVDDDQPPGWVRMGVSLSNRVGRLLLRGEGSAKPDIRGALLSFRCWESSPGFPCTEVLRHARPCPDMGPTGESWADPGLRWEDGGESIVTMDRDMVSRRWRVYMPRSPAPPWITTLAEYMTGWKSDPNTSLLLPMNDNERSLAETVLRRIATGTNEWCRLAAWVLLPPSGRTVSPLDDLTPVEWADKAISANTENDVRIAMAVSPSHPLVRIALAGFIDDPERAAWMKARGLNLLPNDPAVCMRAAGLLMLRKDWPGAQASAARALRARPDDLEVGKLLEQIEKYVKEAGGL